MIAANMHDAARQAKALHQVARRPGDQPKARDRLPRGGEHTAQRRLRHQCQHRPVTSARRLPVADKTSNRLAQPRASTMPMPNINPPMIAPDMLPAPESCRASETLKHVHHDQRLCGGQRRSEHDQPDGHARPDLPRASSTVEARRQNCDRCAATPNRRPVRAPPSKGRFRRQTCRAGFRSRLGPSMPCCRTLAGRQRRPR
jgi:hypothetical protein